MNTAKDPALGAMQQGSLNRWQTFIGQFDAGKRTCTMRQGGYRYVQAGSDTSAYFVEYGY